MLQDLRLAARALRRAPAFALTAILTLALGIGANTAIFSLIDALILRALPVTDPQQLAVLTDPGFAGMTVGTEDGTRTLLTTHEFENLRSRNQVFSGVFAAGNQLMGSRASIEGHAHEELQARLVSGEYFNVLGVTPLIGRTFTAADEKGPLSAPYAVLTYAFWQTHYGGSRAAIGSHISYPRGELTVIGVMPEHFLGEAVGAGPDFWVPLDMQPMVRPGRSMLFDDPGRSEKVMWLQVFGRLRPGVSIEQAQANTNIVFHQIVYDEFAKLAAADPSILRQDVKLRAASTGISGLREAFSDPLAVLMAMVGVVLLIACANVANLLLARATTRQREMSVRLALGATRVRVVRQYVTESLLLSAAGGAVGVLFALWGVALLTRMVEARPGEVTLDVGPDWAVLGFTVAVSAFAGLLFGLAPAWHTARINIDRVLREGGRGIVSAAGFVRFGAGRILVVAQIALSVVLLIAAGWFVRTLENLKNVDLGYPREHVLQVGADFAAAEYGDKRLPQAYDAVRDRLAQIPGVKAVTYSSHGFFAGGESSDEIEVEGYQRPKKDHNDETPFERVGRNYFSIMGIPMLLGREITERDTRNSEPVCVVNEAFAQEFFGGKNPLGKHVKDTFPDTIATFTIIGVAADARDRSLREKIPPRFYLPISQPLGDYPPGIIFQVRTYKDPAALSNQARKAVSDFDPSIRVTRVAALADQIDSQLVNERMVAELSAGFGAIALLLASVGLYGVLAYGVARRTSEIGIRMALGARGGRVMGMILGETAVLLGAGIAIGVPVSLASSRLVQSKLFGLQAADPLTIGAALAVLVGIALLAAYIPARRAANVDPLTALRYE